MPGGFRSGLIGMLIGMVLIICVETAIAVLVLSGIGVPNPLGFIGAAVTNLPALTSPNGLQRLLNSSLITTQSGTSSNGTAHAKVSVSGVYVSGVIGVSGTNLTSNGKLNGTLSYRANASGFTSNAGVIERYNVTIPNYSQFVMHVNALGTRTANFSTLSVSPALPAAIGPGSNDTFTLEIRLPNRPYSGRMDIYFSANLTKSQG